MRISGISEELWPWWSYCHSLWENGVEIGSIEFMTEKWNGTNALFAHDTYLRIHFFVCMLDITSNRIRAQNICLSSNSFCKSHIQTYSNSGLRDISRIFTLGYFATPPFHKSFFFQFLRFLRQNLYLYDPFWIPNLRATNALNFTNLWRMILTSWLCLSFIDTLCMVIPS